MPMFITSERGPSFFHLDVYVPLTRQRQRRVGRAAIDGPATIAVRAMMRQQVRSISKRTA
jgi:hypothetical protein